MGHSIALLALPRSLTCLYGVTCKVEEHGCVVNRARGSSGLHKRRGRVSACSTMPKQAGRQQRPQQLNPTRRAVRCGPVGECPLICPLPSCPRALVERAAAVPESWPPPRVKRFWPCWRCWCCGKEYPGSAGHGSYSRSVKSKFHKGRRIDTRSSRRHPWAVVLLSCCSELSCLRPVVHSALHLALGVRANPTP